MLDRVNSTNISMKPKNDKENVILTFNDESNMMKKRYYNSFALVLIFVIMVLVSAVITWKYQSQGYVLLFFFDQHTHTTTTKKKDVFNQSLTTFEARQLLAASQVKCFVSVV